MPIPPKPPWYSTPTAIVPLPTAVPISCNSLIEFPTDTRKNKSYDNIENNNNDRPDDDNDNDTDVDCFPTPTAIAPLPTAVPNCNSLIESPTDTPATENRKNSSGIENNRPNDDNNNNDDDVDCFPRQDKQPVFPQQDISPTAPTANNTPPSLIESSMDKSTNPTDTDNNNNNSNNDPPRITRTVYRGSAPKPIYDVACFHRHDKKQPTDDDDDDDTYGDSAYDAYDDLAYDDDDDDDDNDSYESSSSDEDYYNYANVIIDMYGNTLTIDDNDNIIPHDDDDNDKPITIQAAQWQINAILSGCTTASSIKEFTNHTKRKQDDFFLPKKTPHAAPVTLYANDNHDAFLHHQWNNTNNNNTSTIRPGTNKPTLAAAAATTSATTGKTTAYAPIEIPFKDYPSVTPTLETLCTLATCSSDPTYNDTDNAILNITVWNQSTNSTVPNAAPALCLHT